MNNPSNSLDELRRMYGLSPETYSGLVNVTGGRVAMPAAPAPVEDENYDGIGPPPGGAPQASGPTPEDADAAASGVPPAMPVAPAPAPPPSTAAPAGGAMGMRGPDPYALPPPTPAVTLPAHWQPGTRQYGVKYGMRPEELENSQSDADAATGQRLVATDQRLDAAKQAGFADAVYNASKSLAMQKADEKIAAINRQKDQFVTEKMQHMADLSARIAKEDPDFWEERGSAAQVGAALAMALTQFAIMRAGHGENTAMQIINAAIDRNIARQKANKASLAAALGAEQNFYRANLDNLGDEKAAVLATRNQYLEQVGSMLDQYKLDANNKVAEANAADMRAQIFKERSSNEERIAGHLHDAYQEESNEKFVPRQVVGGAGGGAVRERPPLVTTPDGTTFAVPKETQKDTLDKMGTASRLLSLNNEILTLRKATAKLDPVVDYTAYNAGVAGLKDMGEEKAALVSKSLEQGTLRDPEYERSQQNTVHTVTGLGTFKGAPWNRAAFEAGNAVIESQNARLNRNAHELVKGLGGEVYQREYARDPSGTLTPTGRYTGQDAKPTLGVLPNGSKRMDGKEPINVADRPLAETTPRSPVRDVAAAPAPSGKGKKDKDARLKKGSLR